MKIFVGNLPYDTTLETLWQLFARYGHVNDVWIGNTRVGAPHAYGFVHMPDGTTTEKTISRLDGLVFEGSEITVHRARD